MREISREVKIEAIRTAVQHMIKKGWFDVCDIDKAAELLGVSFSSDERRFMGLLHCVNFGDMPDEVRSELQAIIENAFTKEPFTIVVGRNLLGMKKTDTLSLARRN